ncbi:MAG: zinc-binding dehydrogenase [Cyclobacteriaceae bacterium]|nr:zinc-binding dehydrogenase [Cyclobacteriaceae bacterium]
MKAVIFKGSKEPLVFGEFPKPKPVKDQVLIKLSAAGLNHRDLWITKEQETTSRPEGIILGSDGVGTVTDVGEDADPLLIGAEVVINPSLEWGNNPMVQGDTFKILGFPDHGTFAEFVAVSKKQIFEKPEGFSNEEVAAMPLSGLTAYRALFSKARLRAKEKVLITGIGGAAALWVQTFAVAYGARVFVTSGSDDKIKKAINLGAAGGFNYKTASWADEAQKTAGGFDIIIDSAGGDQFSKLIDLALPGGRIVNFGRTAGQITNIDTRLLFWKQLSIFGSTMGTRDEFLSMLDFVESRKLKPVIDGRFPLSRLEDAFARMQSGDQFGKIVLTI